MYEPVLRRRSRGDEKESVLKPRSAPRCPCIDTRDHLYDEVYTPSTRSRLSSTAGAAPATGDYDSLEPISIYHPMDSSISDGSSSFYDNPSLIYDVPAKGQSDREHRYENLPVLKPLHTPKGTPKGTPKSTPKGTIMPDILKVSTNVPADILALYAKVNKSKKTKTRRSDESNDANPSRPSHYDTIPAHPAPAPAPRPNPDYETLDEAIRPEEGVIYAEIDVPTRDPDRQQSQEDKVVYTNVRPLPPIPSDRDSAKSPIPQIHMI